MNTSWHIVALALAATILGGVCAPDRSFATDKPAMPLPAAKSGDSGQDKSDSEKPELTPEEARELYKQHQRHLRRIEQEKKDVKKDVKSITVEQERLKWKLIKTAQKVRAQEIALAGVERKIARHRAEEAGLRVKLFERHSEIAKLLAIMQRMGRQPPPAIVTQRSDALKMVRSGMMLNSFFPALKKHADKLSAELSKLVAVLTQLEIQSKKLAEEQKKLASLRLEIRKLIEQRQHQLKEEQSRLVALQGAAKRHSEAISSLTGLLKKLDQEVAKVSGLGAYEKELKSGKIVELKPLAKKAAFVQPGRMKPAIPFSQAKGLLFLPVSGKKYRDFGTKDGFGGISQGISIRTIDEAQVVSPCDGWVVYAGRFRSYGQLLIISAGGGYHVLLAGMENINVNLGQFVLAGEPVATMGRSGNKSTVDDSSFHPTLYVEFRKNERPIDPNPWWATGLRKG